MESLNTDGVSPARVEVSQKANDVVVIMSGEFDLISTEPLEQVIAPRLGSLTADDRCATAQPTSVASRGGDGNGPLRGARGRAMKFQEQFSAEASSVPGARRFVARVLEDCPSALRERVTVMVSELATNAVKHAGTAFSVELEVTNIVRVEVGDLGHGRPRLREPAPIEATGRGLLIVQSLSSDWGVEEQPQGTCVWFTIPVASSFGSPSKIS